MPQRYVANPRLLLLSAAFSRDTMDKDRRIHARAAFYSPVTVRIPPAEGRFFLDSIDLSEGGIFLACDILFDPGEAAVLEFDVGGADKPLTVQATAVWNHVPGGSRTPSPGTPQRAGTGFRFVGLTHADRSRLRDLVAQRASKR